jgi:hypothetical protein
MLGRMCSLSRPESQIAMLSERLFGVQKYWRITRCKSVWQPSETRDMYNHEDPIFVSYVSKVMYRAACDAKRLKG